MLQLSSLYCVRRKRRAKLEAFEVGRSAEEEVMIRWRRDTLLVGLVLLQSVSSIFSHAGTAAGPSWTAVPNCDQLRQAFGNQVAACGDSISETGAPLQV